jgi:hypothetical protein
MSKKLEQVKGHIQDVKNHVVENKKTYLIMAGAVIVAGTTGYVAGSYRKVSANQQAFAYKSTVNQTQIVMTTARGHRGNQILDTDSGIIYPSQNVTAEALGVSPTTVSDHLNGKKPHAGGHHLTNLGEDLNSRK